MKILTFRRTYGAGALDLSFSAGILLEDFFSLTFVMFGNSQKKKMKRKRGAGRDR